MAEELEESNEFKNCDIYIDEFVGFTLQEYEILRKLMRISHEITITICADNLQENTNADIDTFYSNKQTVKKDFRNCKPRTNRSRKTNFSKYSIQI